MSDKRKGFSLSDHSKRIKTQEASRPTPSSSNNAVPKNPHLQHPVVPEKAIAIFLTQARNSARQYLPQDAKLPISRPFCEVEARLGILKSQGGLRDQRVTSSGAKTVGSGQIAQAFMISNGIMESGISKSDFLHKTGGGLSQLSPIAHAFGVTHESNLKRDLVEKEYTETVYAGYSNHRRVVFPGLHPSSSSTTTTVVGKMEHKEKLATLDVTLPAANYDLRISLTSEKCLDSNIQQHAPPGWTMKRVKRRRSYTRRDHSIAWQLDVTQVTTTYPNTNSKPPVISHEVEMELHDCTTLKLINLQDPEKVETLVKQLSQQLWWMLKQLNPLNSILNVEDFLQPHPDHQAVLLAQATCGALKRFMQQQKSVGGSNVASYKCPIGNERANDVAALANLKFMGCMPVNFSRHDLELVQRSADNGYYVSEKTDGVRHLLIFTGTTAVLVDRTMAGKQPIPRPGSDEKEDPFAPVLPLIQPGTVLDGEVVMHRKLRRPIFIVFDVLALSTTQPILQLPFEQRLHHLKRASFRTATANRDMFDEQNVLNPKVALPLVRKNFVKRRELDELLSHVVEEGGMRTYRNGTVHNHLTDGIIFQPNLPYVCGTDVNLLKWKYLDTVTIDVELLPQTHRGYNNNKHGNDDDDQDKLCVGVLGEEGTLVDMTRFVKLPQSELRRLEADRQETGSKIAEVGFDPTMGEWYYLTMRPDKTDPNHISTVLGTLLELAESLTTEELRYRMSVPVGARDTYRKDVGRMQKQLLEHQRKENKAAAAAAASRHSK